MDRCRASEEELTHDQQQEKAHMEACINNKMEKIEEICGYMLEGERFYRDGPIDRYRVECSLAVADVCEENGFEEILKLAVSGEHEAAGILLAKVTERAVMKEAAHYLEVSLEEEEEKRQEAIENGWVW